MFYLISFSFPINKMLRSYTINLLSPMDTYMRPAKTIGENYGRIYAFVNLFSHTIISVMRWIHVHSLAAVVNKENKCP